MTYTDAEKADAADRFIDALDEARAGIEKALSILREQASPGAFSTYPLFSEGAYLQNILYDSRDKLWLAHKPVAIQGYDYHRKIDKEKINEKIS